MADQLLGSAYVRIDFKDLDKLGIKVDQVGQKFNKNFDDMAKHANRLDKEWLAMNRTADKTSNALGKIGGAIATIGIAKFGNDVIGASTKLDNLNRMLINVEGSQTAANKRFEEFKVLAKAPILDPFNLSKFYVQLQSVNVESKTSIGFMKSLANAMAGAGGTNEAFAGFMEQMTQAVGKGKLMGDDLRLMASWFPQMRKYLTEAFGTSMPDKIAEKGYTAIDVMEKLNAVMEKAPKFSGGAQVAQDNFRQSLELFYSEIGKNVLPKLTELLNKLTELMDGFDKLSEPMKNFVGESVIGGVGLLGIAATAGAVAFAISGISGALKTLGVGMAALTSNPAFQVVMAALTGVAIGGQINKLTDKLETNELIKKSKNIGLGELQKAVESQMTNADYKTGDTVSAFVLGTASKYGLPVNSSETAEGVLNRLKHQFYVEKPMNLSGLAETKASSVSPLAISYADMIKEIGEASVDFLMNPYGYSTLSGKTKSAFSPRATGREMFGITLPTSDQQVRQPFTSFPSSGVQISRSNTVSYGGPGMGAGLPRDFSLSGGGTGFDLGKWEKIQRDQQNIMANWSTGIDNFSDDWDNLWEETQNGLKDVKTSWADTAQSIIETGNLFADVLNTILSELGYDVSGWKYKDPKLEAERQEQMKAYERETTPIGWFNKIMGWASQVGNAVLPKMMAEGGSGVVNKPTMFIAGESGPEAYNFTPIGKGGRSGIGTHVEIHNINVPDTWDRQRAENVVVQAYEDAVRHGRIN